MPVGLGPSLLPLPVGVHVQLAAFEWQRPAKSTPSPLAPLAANTGDGLLVVHGNYLLSFSGHTPEAAELKTLFDGLRKGSWQ